MSHGWVGVDLDGVLAHYDGWHGEDHIGEPIPAMLDRVKAWIAEGIDVRIFTARANSDDRFALEEWCLKHIGCALPITATKDYQMVTLYDDRCVQMEKNTGRRVDGKEL